MDKVWEVIQGVLTSEIFLTVISGVLVFVLGQLFIEYFLKPIQSYKQLRAKIAYNLTLYAHFYMNPRKITQKNEDYSNASYDLRKLAAEVDSMIELKPFWNFFIARKTTLREVSKNLIGLSNGFYSDNSLPTIQSNDTCRKNIYALLKLLVDPKRRTKNNQWHYGVRLKKSNPSQS